MANGIISVVTILCDGYCIYVTVFSLSLSFSVSYSQLWVFQAIDVQMFETRRSRLRPKCKSFAYDQWPVKLARLRYLWCEVLFWAHKVHFCHITCWNMWCDNLSIVDSLYLLRQQSQERDALKKDTEIVIYAWQST